MIMNFTKYLIIFFCLLQSVIVHGQIDIGNPVVATGAFAITDTVFMAVNGNDANPGTESQPVKSFTNAISKLPYGTAGVNGGNAYGLIILLEGEYITKTGFQQYTNTWQNGNTFRNVSVEGRGKVVVSGTKDTFAAGHMLQLSGNHIYIKNIELKYAKLHGIYLSHPQGTSRQKHIAIENVRIDSVMGFSILMVSCDTVSVIKTKSYYAARPGADSLTTPCQWPSGIKFLGCTNIEVHDSEIAYTRGEGLNFHNSEYGLAYNNLLHDNGLNLYCDNSAHIVIRNNHIYNTPGIGKTYWRNCPADTGIASAGSGIMMANEGACVYGNLPSFNGCSVNCILPNESYSTVEDIYIYNNLIQNTAKAIIFWEGVTSITGINCIRHVYVFNNTIAGLLADSLYKPTLIQAYFPSYNWLLNSNYSYLQDVRITNNIFAYDTAAFVHSSSFSHTVHGLHPGPMDITFGNNLWIRGHQKLTTGDSVRRTLPINVPIDSNAFINLTPCQEHPSLIYKVAQPAYQLNEDMLYASRDTGQTNVGAFEYRDTCFTLAMVDPGLSDFSLFPNPSSDLIWVVFPESNSGNGLVEIYDLAGRKMYQQAVVMTNPIKINTGRFPEGIYLLKITSNYRKTGSRLFVKSP